MKFTGHERDLDLLAGASTLDYMHARYYDGALARFLSIDPVMNQDGNLFSPQGWNRYSYGANNPLTSVDPTGAILISLTGQSTLFDIAGAAASRVSFNSDGTLDTSKLTEDDLVNNEGALLLYEMAGSQNVYSYEEGTSANSAGGIVPVDRGVLNLDDNPADAVDGHGNAVAKAAIRFPPAGVNGAVTVDPSTRWFDSGTGLLNVPTRAIAFHELAESYSKVERNVHRGSDDGPGAHRDSRDRERYLMMQRPSWTPFPAGGVLRR
jgi:RHS repeat-associated protein